MIGQLDAHELAIIALAPLLDCIYRSWDDRDHRSAEMMLKRSIGKYLNDKLAMKGLLKSPDKVVRAVGRRLSKGGRRSRSEQKYLRPEWRQAECVRAGHWLMQCALSLELL